MESEQAPTKADPAQSVEGGGSKSLFGTDKAFYSCAFYLREGTWDDADSKKEFYIGGEKDYSQDLTFKRGSFIKYDSRGRCWRYHTGGSAYSLYWPGTGTLTFFAWTDNTTAPYVGDIGDIFSCSPENGVKFKKFSILLNNRNRDLMVAEIAKDQTKDKVTKENGEVSYAGVPTVFHHILSKMEFRVQKQGLNDKEVRLKEIKFIKFSNNGTYTQLENGKVKESGKEWTGQYGNPGDKTGWEFFSCGERAEGMEVVDGANVVLPKIYTKKENGDTEESDGLYLYIPQSFKGNNNAELHIKYTVDGTDKEAVKSLEDVYPDGWEIGKNHIVTITITDGNTGGTIGGSIASLYAPDTAAGIRSAVSTTAAVRSAAVTGSVTVTGTTATDSTGSTALILTTEASDWEPVTSNLSF